VSGIVVCNTGPLIALATAESLVLLDHLFDRVLIPEPVRSELQASTRLPKTWDEIARNVTRVEVCLAGTIDQLLASVLDAGEGAVIQLARERRAEWVLMDERKGRRVAREIYQLQVIGSAGLLLRAKKQGLIPNIADRLKRMRESGYYLHERIITRMLRAANE
jgi:hypothetical protein